MNENELLINHFYEGFSRRDFSQMASCYHDQATFQDAVFNLKTSNQTKAMWHMLCLSGKDLTITFNDIKADEKSGSAHWEAFYTFSKTGRKVHNIINAKFEFEDGKIIKHLDSFDFWRWSKQSLGLIGVLLGWSSFLQNKTRQSALQTLNEFIENNPQYR